VIVDGHPVHRSGAATRFAAIHSSRLRLIRMPGYCPELNPDELLNQDVKTNGLGKSRPTNRADLMATVRSHLYRRQKTTAAHHEPVSRTTCSLCRVMHYELFGGRLSNYGHDLVAKDNRQSIDGKAQFTLVQNSRTATRQ